MANILLTFGFCWMIVAAMIGLVLGAGHVRHDEELALAAKAGDLVGYNARLLWFNAQATAHGHSFLWSVTAILVALVLDRLPFPDPTTKYIALTMMAAMVVWTTGALTKVRVLMALADIVFFLLLLVVAGGLAMAALHAGT